MKKKLIFANDVPKQFIEHQDYIKKVLNDFFTALDFDCEVKIKFIDKADINKYESTDCFLKSISTKKHELTITNSVLNSINYDGGEFFCIAVYHEFEHIRDFNYMMKTKLFKFNLCLVKHKNFENQYVSAGFDFWTEIYAYYHTMQFSKRNNFSFEKITFGNLVKNYIKTVAHNKRIYCKKDLKYDEAIEYINAVDSFIYLCAKFMASVYSEHSRMPYARIDKNEDYKKVYSILCKLQPKVIRLMNNAYSPKSYDNLYKLGKYICENVRWKIFKVGLIYKNRKVHSFY